MPAFFGFALAWDSARPYSEALAAVLGPFDRHPLLERLEANRVEHLARAYQAQSEIWALQAQLTRQRAVLQRLLTRARSGSPSGCPGCEAARGSRPSSR